MLIRQLHHLSSLFTLLQTSPSILWLTILPTTSTPTPIYPTVLRVSFTSSTTLLFVNHSPPSWLRFLPALTTAPLPATIAARPEHNPLLHGTTISRPSRLARLRDPVVKPISPSLRIAMTPITCPPLPAISTTISRPSRLARFIDGVRPTPRSLKIARISLTCPPLRASPLMYVTINYLLIIHNLSLPHCFAPESHPDFLGPHGQFISPAPPPHHKLTNPPPPLPGDILTVLLRRQGTHPQIPQSLRRPSPGQAGTSDPKCPRLLPETVLEPQRATPRAPGAGTVARVPDRAAGALLAERHIGATCQVFRHM